MTRGTRRTSVGAALSAIAIAATAGCSATPSAEPPARAVAPAAERPTPPPSADPEASKRPTPSQQTGPLQAPPTTAGPITLDAFPSPKKLGRGWAYSVDPGSAEDGYVGNGTPALQREPAEVVSAIIPFGCRRPQAMAAPRHALEVDYQYAGTKVIAIRSVFDGPAGARAFFEARAANLRACRGHASIPAEGVLVGHVEPLTGGVLLSDRTPASAPWTELAVLNRDAVVLLAAQARIGDPPMRHPARLATAFRR